MKKKSKIKGILNKKKRQSIEITTRRERMLTEHSFADDLASIRDRYYRNK